jgi:hypothetical protein
VGLRNKYTPEDTASYSKAYKLVEKAYKEKGNDPNEFWKLNMINEGLGDAANMKFLKDVEAMTQELAVKAKYRP